ncbi:MAG: arginine--tRNA ligase [Rickettsiales bacterium]|nr:arginine--tRNA ligase [Rickettsiales bacterium]
MHVFKGIERTLHGVIEQLVTEKKLPGPITCDKIEATPPKDTAHGDIATNAALVIAAQVGKKPKEVADILLPLIAALPNVDAAEIAGPGFINIRLKPTVWQNAVATIIAQGTGYGTSSAGQNRKVNVEYVSANPTGPMHVGHGRGAVFGDALANIMVKAGYDVTREYYINDAGGQVDKLADSAFLRYREACGETIGDIPEGLYPGDYLVPVGVALKEKYGKELLTKAREDYLPLVRRLALDMMMELIKSDLAIIGIHHNVFSSEQAVRDAGKVEEAVALLEQKGLIYTGVLEPPKGKPAPEDWEPKPQTLFRSTQFGDDIDRAIKKSDGSWAYITPDIAYHFDKCQRGFDTLIDVFGADHAGYVKRLKAAVSALSGGKVPLDIKLCQLVKFMRRGEPLKMSKRAGTFVTVREVVDEVGKDVFRFIMLTRKNDVPLDFDFEKVMEQSKDNPVFYVQYAHARAHSILRNAKLDVPAAFDVKAGQAVAKLSHPAELELIRLLCGWPRMIESAAAAFEPHRIAFYLQEVAAAFHGLWNLGNDDLGLRFIQKHDIEITAARLCLARAVATVIASGLQVLGVEPLEEMR